MGGFGFRKIENETEMMSAKKGIYLKLHENLEDAKGGIQGSKKRRM